MTQTSALSAWESFYVIVGSSGGGLIGLQFVVLTLIAERQGRTNPETLSAFGTPTVVHLAGALLISAVMSAPWPSIAALAVTIGMAGLIGLAYSVRVVLRAQRQTGYVPVVSDWVWYAALPSVTYGSLAISSVLFDTAPDAAPFVVAASSLTLLLIGIHNAWDTVTHILVGAPEPDRKQRKHK